MASLWRADFRGAMLAMAGTLRSAFCLKQDSCIEPRVLDRCAPASVSDRGVAGAVLGFCGMCASARAAAISA
eukprot:CAMPEP_0115448004 /NCGR_PEP_ID=MMETSP0271-20121206/40263_1 /TAXON_ID=71861 /ORGANISM="Scrippsiella trochoidea, Strain CCMP3099" /LENGTH=71 /DNA_ID=CAMNT_0002874103 /DNA_START=795 /DNA_END=1006 /DNA_ORIENTATION=+